MIIWLYGQPGSGKTTIANRIAKLLKAKQIDGDNLRDVLKNYDYTEKGRIQQNQSILDIARYLNALNIDVIISAVGPYKKYRNQLKETDNAVLVYLHCSTQRGREQFFVNNFEMPDDNEFSIDTANNSVDEAVDLVLKKIYFTY